MPRFHITAIDRIGRSVIKKEMADRGYENTGRTLASWVQRRRVPDNAKVMLMELAEKKGIDLTLEDFDVVEVVSQPRGETCLATV